MRTRRPGTEKEPVQEFESIAQLTASASLADGRLAVAHSPYPVDFHFRDSASNTIVVSFHGAALKTVSLPWHAGRSVMSTVPSKWLAISDPSLLIDEDLKLAWFAGSKHQPRLQSFVAEAISEIMRKVGAEHAIFFGSSGGGFAALEMSRRFPGSLAIPMNPQTSIGKYFEPSVNRYLEKAWSVGSLGDSLLEFCCHDLVRAYDLNHQNTIAYVQNTRDAFHIKNHQRPFFDRISDSSKLWVRTDSWGDPKKTGHVIPPKDEVSNMLALFAESNGEWDRAMQTLGFRLASKK